MDKEKSLGHIFPYWRILIPAIVCMLLCIGAICFGNPSNITYLAFCFCACWVVVRSKSYDIYYETMVVRIAGIRIKEIHWKSINGCVHIPTYNGYRGRPMPASVLLILHPHTLSDITGSATAFHRDHPDSTVWIPLNGGQEFQILGLIKSIGTEIVTYDEGVYF